MEKIFAFIGRFKPQDEFIWTENINLLKFQDMLLDAKVNIVAGGDAQPDNFVVDPSTATEQKTRLYSEMYDSMVKQRYALMQLGWQNDKFGKKDKVRQGS
jgi:hypothetical protein